MILSFIALRTTSKVGALMKLELDHKFGTNIIAMARIYRRKDEIVLVVEEIIFEIVFMLGVVLNRYKNTCQFWGLNVEHLYRYRMADRIPKQIEHMSELVEMSDTDCFDNLRVNRGAFNRLCYLLWHMGG
ncbi:hypothetical protein ACS0TY_011315 [Phlomoides rotata]